MQPCHYMQTLLCLQTVSHKNTAEMEKQMRVWNLNTVFQMYRVEICACTVGLL